MSGARRGGASRDVAGLRTRLADAEATLLAIRNGEVDAVVVAGDRGPQVFTLEGAEHGYRVLIESMNEGALTLTRGKLVLYANECFARMVKRPLAQVIGSSFRRFLSAADRARFRPLLRAAVTSGSKVQVMLLAADGSRVPVQVSMRPVPADGSRDATVSMVVTDMTEARRAEEMLRALSHRVVQAQEAERGRLAVELHDHVTQLLCAVILRSQALANSLSKRDGPARKEAARLREMVGRTAEEVERIARGLRPGVLEHLGLVTVLRSTGAEFEGRTGVPVALDCPELTARLPAETELALYRVLQEALRNVERHARARHVAVGLKQSGGFVVLSVTDDGIGFDPARQAAGRNGGPGLGLLSMSERAAHVGGVLDVHSALRKGTTIRAQVPIGSAAGAGHGAVRVAPRRRAARRRARSTVPRRRV